MKKRKDFVTLELDGQNIHPTTGEILSVPNSDCERPYCKDLEAIIIQKEKEIRGLQLRLGNKQKKDEEDARDSTLWQEGVRLWNYYLIATGHRGRFTYDRFETVEKFLAEFGFELCMRAVDGIAFDPFRKKRLNGTMRTYDDWQNHTFKDRSTFEENCKRAPLKNGVWTPQHLETT